MTISNCVTSICFGLRTLFQAAWLSLFLLSGASASTLLSLNPGSDDSGYGQGPVFTETFNSAFGGADNITTTDDLEDRSQLFSADALLINFNRRGLLNDTEKTNIADFSATGRRVAFIGENYNLARFWNDSFLAIFGASTSPTSFTGFRTEPIVSNSLTKDITILQQSGPGLITGGGKALFEDDVASLFGPSDNVLAHLDSGLANDSSSRGDGKRQFAANIANWLADPEPPSPDTTSPVPLPAGLPLLAAALAAFGWIRHRKS